MTSSRAFYPKSGTTAGTFATGDHTHDSRYYTETETDLHALTIRPLVSGQWRNILGSAVTTGTHSAGLERAQLIHLPPSTALQNVAVNVTTLAASSSVRLGIRSDNNGRPGTLLADWGTIDSTTTGNKTLAITYTTPAGVSRLWLTATAQGGAPVLSVRSPAGSDIDATSLTEAFTPPAAVYQSGVTGALPNTFTAAGVLNAATLIAVQAA